MNAAITHDCYTIFPGSALLPQVAVAPGPCTVVLCVPTSFHMPLPSVLIEQISFPIQGYPIALLIIYSYKKEVMKQTKEKRKEGEIEKRSNSFHTITTTSDKTENPNSVYDFVCICSLYAE